MSTPTDRLPPFEVRRPGLRPWTADGTRREPPGEGLPPVNPLLGRLEPDAAEAHAAHAQSETLASIRTYLALLAQRAAPLNEQVYQGSGVLVAGAPTDLDMGQVPAGIFTRIHRVVIVGSIPGDTPTVSLYPDGVAVGNAIAAWQFGGTPNPPLYATSGVVAAAGSPAATLPNAAGLTTYITGFDVLGGGATAASTILVTVAGLAAGTLTFPVTIPALPAGVNFTYRFPQPMPASAPNSVIIVTAPSFGVGNTQALVTAYGFQGITGKDAQIGTVLPALDVDGTAMAEPRDLNFPGGHGGRRIVARVRGASGNVWLGLFTRSYTG